MPGREHAHSLASARIAERNKVRQVPCPQCGAKAGHHCIKVDGGKRYASHQPRWTAYRETNKTKE